MTRSSVFQGEFIRSPQILQKGSLILVAIMASLMLVFRRYNSVALAVVLAVVCVLGPVLYLAARRMKEKMQQHETEDKLLTQTRTYLSNAEPLRYAPPAATVETDIEILARTIDGSKLPVQNFVTYGGALELLPQADTVVFDALPRRYATPAFCDQRFERHAAHLAAPVFIGLEHVLDALEAVGFGVVEPVSLIPDSFWLEDEAASASAA